MSSWLERTLALALCVAPALAQSKGKAPANAAKLAEARELIDSGEEKDVRRGSELCLEMNDVPAIDLLLEVLGETAQRGGLPPEHYRDIVWEVLPKFTDPYARSRVLEQLGASRDNPWMREWCVELIGGWADADLAAGVKRALGDADDGVRRAAARAAGRLLLEELAAPLAPLARHADPELRANAVEALARIDSAGQKAAFQKALADKDGGVRCALLGALPELYPDLAEKASAAALEDEDWRPRMQAVENLAQARTKSGIDGLVRASGDGRPLVARKALDELQRLTHFKFQKQIQWEAWWKENRESFELPEGESTAEASAESETVVVFNDVRVTSDHIAFLLDVSETMDETLKSKEASKSAAARAELEKVLQSLQGKLTFNVYLYNDQIEALEKRAVPLSPKSEKKALAFVAKARNLGSKNIWQALEAVLADPEVDTAYLLSSGEPEVGKYVHWNRVTEHLRDHNRFRKLVIHTIAYTDSEWYRSQLEKIAEATGGEFRGFE